MRFCGKNFPRQNGSEPAHREVVICWNSSSSVEIMDVSIFSYYFSTILMSF